MALKYAVDSLFGEFFIKIVNVEIKNTVTFYSDILQ